MRQSCQTKSSVLSPSGQLSRPFCTPGGLPTAHATFPRDSRWRGKLERGRREKLVFTKFLPPGRRPPRFLPLPRLSLVGARSALLLRFSGPTKIANLQVRGPGYNVRKWSVHVLLESLDYPRFAGLSVHPRFRTFPILGLPSERRGGVLRTPFLRPTVEVGSLRFVEDIDF